MEAKGNCMFCKQETERKYSDEIRFECNDCFCNLDRLPSDQYSLLKIISAYDYNGNVKQYNSWLEGRIVFHLHSDYWITRNFPMTLLEHGTHSDHGLKLSRLVCRVVEDNRMILVTRNTVYEFEIIRKETR